MSERISAVEFRRVRELHGMTQPEWAAFIGLEGEYADRTVRRYEAGTQRVAGPVRRVIELLREKKEGKRK